jgi:pyroglutamyl-peptidase
MNRQSLEGLEIYGLILPPNYYDASELLLKKAKEISSNVVLSTGLFSSIPRIRFEAIGINNMYSKYADNIGRKPNNEKIVNNGKQFYRTNVDNVALAHSLDKFGIQAEVSVNADYFVCNSLIYLIAKNIEEEKLHMKFGFLHTPWTSDYLNLVDIPTEKTVIPQNTLENAIKISLIEIKKQSLNNE